MTSATDHHPVSAYLGEVEHRLERVLASGWRGAEADLAELTRLAGELSAMGLAELAARVDVVGQAESAAEALHRIALAHVACRMLQVRLVSPLPAPATLQPLPREKDPQLPRLLVVAPLLVVRDAVWACARLERGVATELVLISAAPTDSSPAGPAPPSGGTTPRRLLDRLTRGPQAGGASPGPWLRAEIRDELRWHAMLPLAESAIAVHGRVKGQPLHVPTDKDDVAGPVREQLHAGQINDNDVIVRAGGALRIRRVERALAPSYVWLDPELRLAFERVAKESEWAVVWAAGTANHPTRHCAPRRVAAPGSARTAYTYCRTAPACRLMGRSLSARQLLRLRWIT